MEFAVFSDEPSLYETIAPKARELQVLGMSYTSIGKILGVSDKTAKKAARSLSKKTKGG